MTSDDDDTVDTPTEALTLAPAPGEPLSPGGSGMVASSAMVPSIRAQSGGASREVPAHASTGSHSRLDRVRAATRSALASYRVRIVAWFVALLTLGTFATVLVVGQLMIERVDAGVRLELVREVDEFRALAAGNDPATGEPFANNADRMFDVFLERNIPGPYEVIVTFIDGRPYARVPQTTPHEIEQDPAFLAVAANAQSTVAARLATPVGAVDYLAVPVRWQGQAIGVFAVATYRDLLVSDQDEVLVGALTVGLILLLIGSLLAWRLADRLLAPVGRTAATARAISETDLSQRVEISGYDEVANLARTFNEMLDRVQLAFAAQRRFLDDASHELRTPLTIVRGHLELIDEGDPEERRNTRELLLDELDRMARLVDDLLVLAQADRPDFLNRRNVIAGELAERVREKASVLGPRTWRVRILSDGEVSCDPQRLTQAVLQLAANAVRHTSEGGHVELGVSVKLQLARFWLADDGPGVPPDELPRLFERFYRGRGQARSEGTGLGLSIVRAIAEAHGGRATAQNGLDGGAVFVIEIPVAPPATLPAAR